jgi:outer membrane receptor protein involved in Fe transport
MRKSYCFLAAFLMAALVSATANGQAITITGNVKNGATKENVSSVSVIVKGTSSGTYTNPSGNFSIRVAKLPATLVISSVGFEPKEVTVSDASELQIEFTPASELGETVVVAASRKPQRKLEAEVTIETMNSGNIRNMAAPSYYEAISNLKGVDMHTASLTFRTVTTRGFVSSGNTRLNQLVDGMDNQAPGLNFSVSSIVGLTEMDVDNIELLSGASSALYGSGGINGTLLINSKNPFKYQGLSFNIKQGIMHTDGKQRNPAPYYNWSFRYAKAINDKFAFKISLEMAKGSDWQADDYRNKAQTGILSTVKGGNRSSDPNFNGINIYGDETSFNMDGFAFYVQDQIRRGVLAATGNGIDLVALQNIYYGAIGNPVYPTPAQIAGFSTFAGFPAQVQGALQSPGISAQTSAMFPFYNGFKNNYFKGANVSRTGYNEKDLVDYNSLNVKMNVGLHWKITENIEASWNSYIGTGTTVYTGANRYSLKNFKIGQHKLEFKGKNWMVRGYTTQENSGDSYIGDAVGSFLNEAARPSSVWFPTYIGTFSEARRAMGLGAITNVSDITLHNQLRDVLDNSLVNLPFTGFAPIAGSTRFLPGSPQFVAASQAIKTTPINKPLGSKFLDKSDLYATEFQVNVSDAAHFSDKLEIIVGGGWKQWVLKSQGTIFADTAGNVTVSETGGYLQLKKKLLNDVLTLTGALRYDVQSNFDGRWTPRIGAVIKVAKENFLRMSYQTAYRFPSNQNQYINLALGGGAGGYLIGSLPEFQTLYKLNSTLPGYTATSVFNTSGTGYRNGTMADSNRLVQAVFKPLTPETVGSYEIGYRGVINKKLLIDAYAYQSRYKNFILSTAVVQSIFGNKYEVYSSASSRSISYNQNSDQIVKSTGWGIGLEYQVFKKYFLFGNVFSDKLNGVPAGEVTFFNAPKYRYNIGLRNENVCHNIGFNVVMKWQDDNYYEGTFITGTLPSFAWIDAQISWKMPKTKSLFRIGGTNLANNYARTGFGSPYVGGLYYISYGYNL